MTNKNRLNIGFHIVDTGQTTDKRTDDSKAQPRQNTLLDEVFESPTRQALREHLFLAEPDQADHAKPFLEACQQGMKCVLSLENATERKEECKKFLNAVRSSIDDNPSLKNNFVDFLKENLGADSKDITKANKFASFIILADPNLSSDLLQSIINRDREDRAISNKFINICREMNLLKDPCKVAELIDIYLEYGKCRPKMFISEMFKMNVDPKVMNLRLRNLLSKHMEEFSQAAQIIIEFYKQHEEAEDSVKINDSEGFNELRENLANSWQGIDECQKLLACLYSEYPDKKQLSKEDVRFLVRSIDFARNYLVDLSEPDLGLCGYGSSPEANKAILDFCNANIDDMQYRKRDLVNDLKYLIVSNMQLKGLSANLVADCFTHLFVTDAQAARQYGLEILTSEQNWNYSLERDLRERILASLDTDPRLIEFLREEANADSDVSCDNLIAILDMASDLPNAHPILEALLNDPNLSFGHFMDVKLGQMVQEVNYLKFSDAKNIVCKQFDRTRPSYLASRMEGFLLEKLKGLQLDISILPEGEYKDWLYSCKSKPESN